MPNDHIRTLLALAADLEAEGAKALTPEDRKLASAIIELARKIADQDAELARQEEELKRLAAALGYRN
jgi:hypothetical protein